MPNQICVLGTSEPIAFAASSQRCILSLISATDSRVRIKEWSVWFDGWQSSARPVNVLMTITNTSHGNMTTGTNYSQVVRHGETNFPMESIGRVIDPINTSSEPTSSGYIIRRFVHSQGGFHEKFPFADEPEINNGMAIGIFINSPSTVNAMAEIVFEE